MFLKRTETTNFDPSIPAHRAAVKNFMKRCAWVDSEFRFTQDPKYSSIASQVQAKLLQWYMDQEYDVPNAQNVKRLSVISKKA